MLENYKAVLWDIDGTLLDSEPVHARCIIETGRRENILVTHAFVDSLVGVGYQGTHKKMQEDLGLTMPFDTWRDIVEDYYVHHAPHQVMPRENVLDVVLSLAKSGVKQCTVSNSPRKVVDANMNCLANHMSDYGNPFEFSISRDDVYEGKPSPEGFLMAAQRLGIKPEECLVVEDSVSGMKAGKAAGMGVVAWPQVSTMDCSPATFTITNLSDLFTITHKLYIRELAE